MHPVCKLSSVVRVVNTSDRVFRSCFVTVDIACKESNGIHFRNCNETEDWCASSRSVHLIYASADLGGDSLVYNAIFKLPYASPSGHKVAELPS